MHEAQPIPAHELTEAHFLRHPVWQFCTGAESGDGVDGSFVLPATGALQPGSFGSYLVYASYRLQNGQTFAGAVQVDILGAKLLPRVPKPGPSSGVCKCLWWASPPCVAGVLRALCGCGRWVFSCVCLYCVFSADALTDGAPQRL